MRAFQKFSTQHEDFIHDLSYDFYGKRMATCSSDQKIKVWDLNDRSEWVCSAEWKAHNGSIWRVEWAHPEFGTIIASCSFDRTVCVWEEQEGSDGTTKWLCRATLLDSRQSVQDIKFAPRHLGLRLATCSLDGIVRIYEAMDVTDLSHWTLMDEFEAQKGGNLNCIAWNPSPFEKPMIVVGADDPQVKIWEYSESQRRWQVAVMLIGHKGPIHDVAWAPNLGRSYYLIATASKDHTVRIWQVDVKEKTPEPTKENTKMATIVSPSSSYHATEVACFSDHKAEVWRVEWNITGTILASSGDDGTVMLWKANLLNQWKLLTVINTSS